MKKIIIFTDLDGTLLDRYYSFESAREALGEIKKRQIPLVFCTSKTRAEIEKYREATSNTHPFVSENGGGIFIPDGYFPEEVLKVSHERCDGYWLIRLGTTYENLKEAIRQLRERGYRVRGFSDMSPEEVARLTGLGVEEAKLAKMREFDEPFIVEEPAQMREIIEEIKGMGLRYTKGRIHHIMGNSDKGRAVEILVSLYRRLYPGIVTIGLGDSANDLEMLQRVDYPVLITPPEGEIDPSLKGIQRAIITDRPGPEGWNRVVLALLGRLK